VLTARIERKQTDLAGLTSQLEAAHQISVSEFSGLISGELDKRRRLITERLLQVLDVDPSFLTTHEVLALPQHTGAVAEFARSVREIAQLRPNIFWGSNDGPGISSTASALLENLKKFKELSYESQGES
jgi:hypothetical protein